MDLFRACELGHTVRVRELIEKGQDVNIINIDDNCTPLMKACQKGYLNIAQDLIRAKADVNLKVGSWGIALHSACASGLLSLVRFLLDNGSHIDEQDGNGRTPLMLAVKRGHCEVVLELIRAGASVTAVSSCTTTTDTVLGVRSLAAGSTALHVAAVWNEWECGVLLVEAGADIKTKNKDLKSPLDLASDIFRQCVLQAASLSIMIRHSVAVIGNAGHGKSTLIACLQAESKSVFKRFVNKFARVEDVRRRTAGIEAVQFSSRRYGNTLFYDFAGQAEYHGPHQSFLEAMLSKPEMAMTVLLLMKVTDYEDILLQQAYRWLQPLALMSTPPNPQIVVVGSFLDQVKSREGAFKKLLRCVQSMANELPFNIQGPVLLDCRKPESEGIHQICTFLQESCPLLLHLNSVSYNLHWVLVQLRKAFSAPAIDLFTLQSWLRSESKLYQRCCPPAEMLCYDAMAIGHALFLPNKQNPSKSWLVLDLQVILHEVYGTLFSGLSVNKFGLLHCQVLAELFPTLDLNMIQELLINLDFCVPIDLKVLTHDLQKLTASDEVAGWLYFPALVQNQPPGSLLVNADSKLSMCWQLRTAQSHFISAHILHTIILRLACNHVFAHELSGERMHCCSVWWNGLSWMTSRGVDIEVQISHSHVVQVVGCSENGHERLCQYVSTVVRDIMTTIVQLSPKLEASSYIVHPCIPAVCDDPIATSPSTLYPVSSIVHVIRMNCEYVLSLSRESYVLPTRTSVKKLFGGWPPLSIIQNMDFNGKPQSGALIEPQGLDLSSFEEHYNEVVRNQASITLQITKCTTIGPPRIGKTCLKHLLTGQKWDVKVGTASTDVMEAPEWVECYSVEEGRAEGLWKLLSAEQRQGELLRAINTLNTSGTHLTARLCDTPLSETPHIAKLSHVSCMATASDVLRTATSNDAIPTITGALPTAELTDVPSQPALIDVTYGDAPPTTTFSSVPPTASPSTTRDTLPTAHCGVPHAAATSDASFTTPPIGAPPKAILTPVPPVVPPSPVLKPHTIMQALKALAGACSPDVVEGNLKDKAGKVLGETRLVHFIDTGGQPVYHDVHPVLITSPSVYLVVFSLKEVYQKSGKEQLNYFRSDLIQRPLRSIFTFGTENPEEKLLELRPEAPTVFIVGTHLDQIPQGNDREQSLWMLHEVISTEIGNKPYRQFVQYDPEGRSFWAVDNTVAGREQDEGVKKYLSTLRMMVQDRSMEMSVRVPLTWMLLKLVMEGKGVRYCKYSELLEEACIRGYVREQSPIADLDNMLTLFHILGLVYHKVPSGYKKEDSLVFIDPDCLYSTTSDFVMAAKEMIENGNKEYLPVATCREVRQCGEAFPDIQVEELMPRGIVRKALVIERMKGNLKSIQTEMEMVLQRVESILNNIGQEPTAVMLGAVHTLLTDMGKKYMSVPHTKQEASSAEAKRRMFIGSLLHSLVTTVEGVLCDLKQNQSVYHVIKEMSTAVKNIRTRCQRRAINNHDMDHFLLVLSDLRIIARLNNSDCYVVPAALPKAPLSVDIVGSADPILITLVSQTIMQVCYLPSGLFCCLISELVTGLGWTVIPLERTHVTFMHKDLSARVHMIEHESFIEVKLESDGSLPTIAQTCQTVRKCIHQHIVQVYCGLYSGPTADSAFEHSLVWGFHCQNHPADTTHIAAFEEDKSRCWTQCLLQGCGMVQDATPAQQVWSSWTHFTADNEFKLTKCVTIQTQSGQKFSDEWMQCYHVSCGQMHCFSKCGNSEWKWPDRGTWLLHVNAPNPQVYPLPLLITPAHCAYLITFNLPKTMEEEIKVLTKLHHTLKDVYTYYHCEGQWLNEEWCHSPKVFLIGLQMEKTDVCEFAQKLSDMLKRSLYECLLVFPKSNKPFWINPGAHFSICDNTALMNEIQSYSCPPTPLIHQCLLYYSSLVRHFRNQPFVLYNDVESKMEDVALAIKGCKSLEQFLTILHCFGLVYYRSLPGLAQTENVVVLQPQYLCRLFEVVEELSKKRKLVTFADITKAAAALIPQHVHKWFQAVCINMNLVIEQSFGYRTDYIFLMGLEPDCDPPLHAHYSVDPLLVTCRSQNFMHKGSNCFLPSFLFLPTFVSTFLKRLKKRDGRQREPIAMKQHYLHVSLQRAAADVHVAEKDSFIEIGLQQFHVGYLNIIEWLDRLQESCQEVYSIVSESAECATAKLRPESCSLQFGFLCQCDHVGIVDPDNNTVTCSCCNVPKDLPPRQQIWFSKVDRQKVNIQPGPIPKPGGGESTIMMLEAASVGQGDEQSYLPVRPNPPSLSIDQVLDDFRDRFIKEMDANAIIFELEQLKIITEGKMNTIRDTKEPKEKNATLHLLLKKTSTKDSMMTVCKVIIAVEGNPKMQKLGEDMMKMLSSV